MYGNISCTYNWPSTKKKQSLGLLCRCGECFSVCRKISEKHGRLWTHGEWSKTSPGGVRENEPAACLYVYFHTGKWVIYGEKKKLRIETGVQPYHIAVVSTSEFERVEQLCTCTVSPSAEPAKTIAKCVYLAKKRVELLCIKSSFSNATERHKKINEVETKRESCRLISLPWHWVRVVYVQVKLCTCTESPSWVPQEQCIFLQL